MPQPKPSESHDEFISRCVPYVLEEGTAENQEQAVAICESYWDESMSKFVEINKTEEEKQIVWGVVYPPGVLDSQGDAMTKEEIEKMAYNFMKEGRLDKIDIGHNFKESGCQVVESFIARENDPDFPQGSWVIAVQCTDEVWQKVKTNELNGFSFAGTAAQKRARVMLEVSKEVIGETKENTDTVLPPHTHIYVARFNKEGRVIGGCTDTQLNHSHPIKAGTSVEKALGHAHRITFEE